jgi:hypothetical protein
MHLIQQPHTSERRLLAKCARILVTLGLGVALVPVAAHPARATGQPITVPFPRTAIWWANTTTQSAVDRANCDLTALSRYEPEHIAELRAANPDIIVLGSTSASAIAYDLTSYNHPYDVELRSASTDWMLTQVGSTLAASITSSATTASVADGTRFRAGDVALLGGWNAIGAPVETAEVVRVTSVSGNTLTLARGEFWPRSAHTSGARIAPVVSLWPGSICFDLTANCHKADVGYGAETWTDWNVRRGHTILDSADWDGLYIDCLYAEMGWSIGADVYHTRSIDPNRSNVPVTDNYAAFNAAWYAGGLAYGNLMRTVVGDKLIVANDNLKNYAINGTVFENFPTATMPLATWNYVFAGPWYNSVSAPYPDWCANAADPALSVVYTQGTQTNYQLMRFGLCSALLSNGFYQYAPSGTSVDGLWRYDEYDNAGAGKGYLGQPTGPATQVGGAWRRDYTGGIALVNPSANAVTVQLGGTFRKIKGTQAPTVNDGSLVTAVTIPSKDGLVLLRPATPAAPSRKGTPSTPSTPPSVKHGRSFTTFGYIIRRTSGTYPVTLRFYRYQSGHWVLRKSITAKVSNILTFSKYSRSTYVPYSGKWRVRALHKVGTRNLYSGYRYFTAS